MPLYWRTMIHSKHLILLNPIAGKGRAGERLPEIEAGLKARGIEYELRLTTGVWHAAELARAAGREGFRVLVAAGGDGTVNEAINGLMIARAAGEKIPVLGVLSVGRGNDFSYGADVPGDLDSCLDVIAAGLSRPMDIGQIKGGDYPDGRYFGNGIGIGFDTIVGLEAAKMKRVHGFMAYVLGALKTLVIYPPAPEVKVEAIAADGATALFAQRSHQISIMNGKRMGGTFFMAPDASNEDGLLDMCMAEDLRRGEMIGLVLRYTKGTQAGHPRIKTGRYKRYSVNASGGGLVVHADGETICVNGTSLEISCVPSAFEILCRPTAGGAVVSPKGPPKGPPKGGK
jgi:diacylglycerol kinase (ATP)